MIVRLYQCLVYFWFVSVSVIFLKNTFVISIVWVNILDRRRNGFKTSDRMKGQSFFKKKLYYKNQNNNKGQFIPCLKS